LASAKVASNFELNCDGPSSKADKEAMAVSHKSAMKIDKKEMRMRDTY
jgi:hypothetical protein